MKKLIIPVVISFAIGGITAFNLPPVAHSQLSPLFTRYRKMTDKSRYSIANLVVRGRVLSNDKVVVTTDTPNKQEVTHTVKDGVPYLDPRKLRWPLFVVKLSVDEVKMGVWQQKTIEVYSRENSEVKVGEYGDWFINTLYSFRWGGSNGDYLKELPVFPGGVAQARADFKQELADKYASDRAENIARYKAMKAKFKP